MSADDYRDEAEETLSAIRTSGIEPVSRWKVTRTYEFDDLAEALSFFHDKSVLTPVGAEQLAEVSFQGMDEADSKLLHPEGCETCGKIPWERISRNRKVCVEHAA